MTSAFRARLIADPKAAIQEAVGVAIPDDFTVRIHQETATDFHLVVPPAGGAMSDAEIEEASRGGNW